MTAPVFRFAHRVPYYQCTVGNHIYYARYLDILEQARGEFARALGSPLGQLQDLDIIFPVTEASLKYLAPARYDDLLSVELWLTQLTRVRMQFEYQIMRGEQKLLEGRTAHVCTSVDEKPKRMPQELMAKLQPWLRVAEGATASAAA